MIEQQIASNVRHLALVPNCSLSWPQTQRVGLVLGLPLMVVGTLFAYAGLWPVLPFMAATVLSLWAALYITNLRQRRREVLTITDSQVILQRGRRRPETEARYPRHGTRLVVRRGPRPGRARQLFLRCHGQEVEVGRALNCEDKRYFIDCFRKAAASEGTCCRAA